MGNTFLYRKVEEEQPSNNVNITVRTRLYKKSEDVHWDLLDF